MGAGSINNPEKKYHIECKVMEINMAKNIVDVMKANDIYFKQRDKIMYMKDGEEISKFLAFIGAAKSVMKFEEIRVERHMNNKVNMDFVFRFQRKIFSAKANIIEFLIHNDGKFYGSYRDFAEAMGKPKSDATNLCRHIHELEDMGIVTSIVDETANTYKKTLIGLNDDWQDRI